MSKPILGYWYLRGLGEFIRYVLHYKGIDFEDKRYLDEVSWQNDKFQLNLDFPNLPYFIDDNVRLTQSTAILRYLARKYDLIGQTEEERVRAELAEQQLIDIRNNMIRVLLFSKDEEYEKLKSELIQDAYAQMKLFSAFLGDRKYLAGDNITYVDFMAYEAFDFHHLMIPTIFNEYPKLKEYQKRFENLPELQEYFHSETYKRWPILAPFSRFGGGGAEPERL